MGAKERGMVCILLAAAIFEGCLSFVIGGSKGLPRGLKVVSDEYEADLYSILGVPSSADEGEIRRAFRRKARSYHPDKIKGGPDDMGEFEILSFAAETLTDEGKRRNYDMCGLEGVEHGCSFADKKRHLARRGWRRESDRGTYAHCNACCRGEWGADLQQQCKSGPCKGLDACRAA